MGERFWCAMYHEAKRDGYFWWQMAMGEAVVIGALMLAFVLSLR